MISDSCYTSSVLFAGTLQHKIMHKTITIIKIRTIYRIGNFFKPKNNFTVEAGFNSKGMLFCY